MSAKNEASLINFSVDLISEAKRHIAFLRKVNLEKQLNNQTFLKRALYRYEKFWLPLCISKLGKTKQLYPPLDVAWIWSCHMLSPKDYIKDCINNFGMIIDHSYQSEEEIMKRQEETKNIWETMFESSFDYLSLNRSSIGDETSFDKTKLNSKYSYDILAAAMRQKSFFYQVSLPHYEDDQYLKICLDSYKKFLFLKKKNPLQFIVPTYGIDLIWHTHQVNPIAYDNDTKEILGFVLPHDDSVNDRDPESKLTISQANTEILWNKLFQEKFSLEGGMFRGDPPDKDFFSSKKDAFRRKYYFSYGNFFLSDIKIMPVEEKLKFKIKILQGNTVIRNLSVKGNTYKSLDKYTKISRYEQINPNTLILMARIKYYPQDECNLIRICKNVKAETETLQLMVPDKETEIQEFEIDLNISFLKRFDI